MQYSTKARWIVASACCAIVAMALSATESRGAFSIKLSDGLTEVLVEDGGANDSDGATGAVTWQGSIGVFATTFGGGISTPLSGDETDPEMHLTGLVSSTAPGGVLTMALTQTGFTGTPMGVDAATFLSAIGGFAKGVVSMETWVGLANGAFEESIRLSNFDGDTFAGAFSAVDPSAETAVGSLFSLTMIVKVKHGFPERTGGRVTSSFDAQLEALPEPSMVAMWAGMGGCAALGAVIRRRKLNA